MTGNTLIEFINNLPLEQRELPIVLKCYHDDDNYIEGYHHEIANYVYVDLSYKNGAIIIE